MSKVPITTIKENMQTLLQVNNTTTSSVLDLSDGMVNRVQKILKINPEAIPQQASFYPLVTIWMEGKVPEFDTIAKKLSTAAKVATITMNIAGIVWNANLVSDDEDPSDEDTENLMENIEEILRSDDTFSGTVKWHKSGKVSYHNAPFDEDSHLRAGLTSYEMKVFY